MAYTVVPSVIDGDDLTDDFTLNVKAACDELQAVVDETRTTWSSPISGGITVGSGTTQADYYQVGPMTFCTFRFIFGAGSSVTGSVTLDLPVDSVFQYQASGFGEMFDTSTSALHPLAVVATTSTAVAVRAIDTSTTYGTTVALSSTIPFTWASGDVIVAHLSYFHA